MRDEEKKLSLFKKRKLSPRPTATSNPTRLAARPNTKPSDLSPTDTPTPIEEVKEDNVFTSLSNGYSCIKTALNALFVVSASSRRIRNDLAFCGHPNVSSSKIVLPRKCRSRNWKHRPTFFRPKPPACAFFFFVAFEQNRRRFYSSFFFLLLVIHLIILLVVVENINPPSVGSDRPAIKCNNVLFPARIFPPVTLNPVSRINEEEEVKVGLADPGGTCETSSIRKNIVRSSSRIIFIVSILASSLLVSEYSFPFKKKNAFSVTPLPRMVLLLLVLLGKTKRTDGRRRRRRRLWTEAMLFWSFWCKDVVHVVNIVTALRRKSLSSLTMFLGKSTKKAAQNSACLRR